MSLQHVAYGAPQQHCSPEAAALHKDVKAKVHSSLAVVYLTHAPRLPAGASQLQHANWTRGTEGPRPNRPQTLVDALSTAMPQ